MQRQILTTCLLTSMLALAACNTAGADPKKDSAASGSPAAAAPTSQPLAPPAADGMLSHDPGPGEVAPASAADDKPRPDMQIQVVLDRLGFTPGVVDGKTGLSTRNALMGFQEANGLPVTGKPDEATTTQMQRWFTIPATRLVTIPADFAAGPFAPTPKAAADQAALPALGYQSLDEKLAERFHTTIAVLHDLNPQIAGAPPVATGSPTAAGASPSATPVFADGQQIRVPNIGADAIDPTLVKDPIWLATLQSLGVGTAQPDVARIVVSKAKGTLRAYDGAGKLVALYTVTTGSSHDPLPLGNWKINGISHNPKFSYNPELFWNVADKTDKQMLPPGPNGPVGVVWIDLSKPHYGIHGTPEPETIGRAQSHGCVRLTNWDVARLAQMVSTRTKVEFTA
ncbi:L,D-transpeptidase family protein [Novosphingobium lentum]|uniref:L,D-transpeptidase family protein n=1 Tax=Novosphingobium lentum TaxID=145287 RepID=UPI000833D2C9|nr:L,D-transpeptidase family protein [Novosphingobium lentum]